MTSFNYLLIDWSTSIVWQAALLCIPCMVHVAVELCSYADKVEYVR